MALVECGGPAVVPFFSALPFLMVRLQYRRYLAWGGNVTNKEPDCRLGWSLSRHARTLHLPYDAELGGAAIGAALD